MQTIREINTHDAHSYIYDSLYKYGMQYHNIIWLALVLIAYYSVQATLPWQEIGQTHKSHNAPVSYPTMHHSEQKCAHFWSELFIVGYGTSALWDLWNGSIGEDHP